MYYKIQYFCIGNIVHDRKLTLNNKEYMMNLSVWSEIMSLKSDLLELGFSICNIKRNDITMFVSGNSSDGRALD